MLVPNDRFSHVAGICADQAIPNILQCKSAERAVFKSIDRLVFAGLYRLVPGILDALKILKPETVRRAVQAVGRIVPNPHLGDLHHQYVRI
jgi:hypothetical protein